MAKFKESEVKQSIRLLIRDAVESLQRTGLTYLGLPAERAFDIKALDGLLKNVICIDEKETVLNETRRSIASMPLKERKFIHSELWHYLRDGYPAESLVADAAFLDFYGGGITKTDPFAEEIAGLRSYFAKHARYQNQAFVLAWTYNPRDKGTNVYLETLNKIIDQNDIRLLEQTTGVSFRSVAIRLLLRQSFREHGMTVNLFHHALYKQVMSTIIVVYSKGTDPQCRLIMEPPDSLLTKPCCVYTPGEPVPKLISLLEE